MILSDYTKCNAKPALVVVGSGAAHPVFVEAGKGTIQYGNAGAAHKVEQVEEVVLRQEHATEHFALLY